MEGSPLTCTKCYSALPAAAINLAEPLPCPACGTPLQAAVFPAYFRAIPRGNAGELAVQEGQATCFYHPEKVAHVPCDACGRFICALCDVELHGEHLCPGCIEAGRRKGKITTLENKRVLYDNIALSLAVLPLLAWPLTIVTAPATIVFSIVTWRKPSSLAPRTKIRFIAAILFSVMVLIGWALVFYGIANVWRPTINAVPQQR